MGRQAVSLHAGSVRARLLPSTAYPLTAPLSVPIAFALLDPEAACAALARGLNRPVRYVEGPVEIQVPIPAGYREQLDALQALFGAAKVGGAGAPYWWEGLFDADVTASGSSTRTVRTRAVAPSKGAALSKGGGAAKGASVGKAKKVKKGEKKKGAEKDEKAEEEEDEAEADDEAELNEDEAELLRVPRKLWAGWRDLEGYAHDVFPVEEKLNDRTWMGDESDTNEEDADEAEEEEEEQVEDGEDEDEKKGAKEG